MYSLDYVIIIYLHSSTSGSCTGSSGSSSSSSGGSSGGGSNGSGGSCGGCGSGRLFLFQLAGVAADAAVESGHDALVAAGAGREDVAHGAA